MRALLIVAALSPAASAANVAPARLPLQSLRSVVAAYPPEGQKLIATYLTTVAHDMRELPAALPAPAPRPGALAPDADMMLNAFFGSPDAWSPVEQAERLTQLSAVLHDHVSPEQRDALASAAEQSRRELGAAKRRELDRKMKAWARALGRTEPLDEDAVAGTPGSEGFSGRLARSAPKPKAARAAPKVEGEVQRLARLDERLLNLQILGGVPAGLSLFQMLMGIEDFPHSFLAGLMGFGIAAIVVLGFERRRLARLARGAQAEQARVERDQKLLHADIRAEKDRFAKGAWEILSATHEPAPRTRDELRAEVERRLAERGRTLTQLRDKLAPALHRAAQDAKDDEDYRRRLVEIANKIKDWASAGGELPPL